jgi:hypothetical protein
VLGAHPRPLLAPAHTLPHNSNASTFNRTHKGNRFVRNLHAAPSFCSNGLNTTGAALLGCLASSSPPPPAAAALLDLHSTLDALEACCCCCCCCCWWCWLC